MKLSDFDYRLPNKYLAQYPSEERDECKLMLLNRKEEKIEHLIFKDIIDFYDDGDVIVLNNTKVFPARLFGNKEKTGARIEVFLLRELNQDQRLWDVLVDPARKIRIGNKLYFGEDESLVAEVIDNTTSRGRTLRFLFDGPYEEFRNKLQELGETPLPKYINRPVEPQDKDRFQTIYAKNEGAVAAPTAGLHLTKDLLEKIEAIGVSIAKIDLVVGLDTFRPVTVDNPADHVMHSERYSVSNETWEACQTAKRVVAVGTTTVRALESAARGPLAGRTDLFLRRGSQFKIVDSMMTNFHMPKSTLLMMIDAFIGARWKLLYQEALDNQYRFLSFGDAMLLHRMSN